MKTRREYHELSFNRKGDPSKALQYRQKDISLDQEIEHMHRLSLDLGRESLSENNSESLIIHNQYVRVAFTFSPLNPADINAVQGVYPSPFSNAGGNGKKKWRISNESLYFSHLFNEEDSSKKSAASDADVAAATVVGGSEGIGYVTHTSNSGMDSHLLFAENGKCDGTVGTTLQVGDLVTPSHPQMGTWRSSVVGHASAFTKIPRQNQLQTDYASSPAALSTISQIGGTAYRLLEEHLIPLKSRNSQGSHCVIVQNGGASAVGLMVGELASLRQFRVKVVSIVRRGNRTEDEFQQLCDYLYSSGKCTLVVEEDQLLDRSSGALQKLRSDLRNLDENNNLPSLALNCVGGESATVLAKCLSTSGTMVTYGGMSKKPVTIPTSQLIFSDLNFCGYWHSRWIAERSTSSERVRILQEIVNAILDHGVEYPRTRVFELHEYLDALDWCKSDDNNMPSAISLDGIPLREKAVFRCNED